MLTLNTLNPEDIDQKIKLNEQDGVDIYQLRELIYKELCDFRWTEIRAKVQCQCYEEQLVHIDKRIAEAKAKAVEKCLTTAQ
jgi:hypothetical protein